MRLVASIFILFTFSTLLWASPEVASFQSKEELGRWLTYYYQDPRPDQVVPAVGSMSSLGLLDRRAMSRVPMVTFLALVFRAHRDQLPEWFSQWSGLPQPHQHVLWQALWLSGTSEGQALLRTLADKVPLSSRQEIENLLSREPVDILEVPVDSPAVLDMLWGGFSASGDARYVRRIIAQLAPVEKETMENRITREAARWSLASNARQHERVLDICAEEVIRQQDPVKTVLQDIIREGLQPLD